MINKKSKLSTTMSNKKNGFTMIELLVVIVILGILSALGLGSFTAAQQKSRDSRRKSDLKAIGVALETYYNDYGNYPLDGGGTGNIYGCSDGLSVCTQGSLWGHSNGTTYMVILPTDPSGGKYFYISSDGSSYQIYAKLENDRDPAVPEDGSENPTTYAVPGSDPCVTGECNYGSSSSNVSLLGVNP